MKRSRTCATAPTWKMDKAFKQATFLVTKLEKLLQRNCRRIPPDSVQGARQTIAELRESIRSKDDPGVRQGYEELRRFQEKYFPGAHKPMTRIILEVVSLALAVSLLLHTFVVAAFTIPTPSMDPTLAPGDVILVWKSAYAVNIPFSSRRLLNIRKPRRWEVVVFSTTHIAVEKKERGKDFIKRVVGLPGEEIEIKNGDIYVNGQPVPRPRELRTISYISKGLPAFRSRKIKVPPGMYFVLGDNTYNSEDSRFWGFVPERSIRGRAFLVFFPVNRFHSI